MSDDPLGQSVPRLMGWSGSPSTWTTCGVTFLALSPRVWMMTPQLTAQYGQVERVSVVRAIFSSCDLRVGGFQVEAEDGSDGGAGANLQETSACRVHEYLPNGLIRGLEKYNTASVRYDGK